MGVIFVTFLFNFASELMHFVHHLSVENNQFKKKKKKDLEQMQTNLELSSSGTVMSMKILKKIILS